jgi:hypothetical protein
LIDSRRYEIFRYGVENDAPISPRLAQIWLDWPTSALKAFAGEVARRGDERRGERGKARVKKWRGPVGKETEREKRRRRKRGYK